MIRINSNQNCKNFGIYAAMCITCGENCVGQAQNSYNIRWNAHRENWKTFQTNFNVKDISDESALFRHYSTKHNDNLKNLSINKAFKVAFIDQPNRQNLDYKEQYWIEKLKSNINLIQWFN